MLNLMVDLEAFGARPRGLIVSIGAVLFDDELPPESCVLEGESNQFYGVLSNGDVGDSRFVVDGDVMAWWATQGLAFAQLMQEMCTRGERVDALFTRFGAWLKRFEGTPLRHWGNAPSYDTVLLENAFRTLDQPFPLAYKTERDYRTLMELAHGAVRPSVPASGVHNALFDAVEQAKLATAAIQMLRRQPAAPLVIAGYPTLVDLSGSPFEASASEIAAVVGNPNIKVISQVDAPAVAKPLGQSEVISAPAVTPEVPVSSPALKFASMDGITEVVFVDFDGVLQTPALSDWTEMEYAPALEQLLADKPNMGVVPTTTHRDTNTPEEILSMLPEAIAKRVVGITPVTKSGRAAGGRQAEIETWLKQHPRVERWVAVDDEAYLYRADCAWLVATFKWMGWTEDTTDAVHSVLEGRAPDVKLVASLGGRGSVLPAGWADTEDEFGSRSKPEAGRGRLAQDEVRASTQIHRGDDGDSISKALAASRGAGAGSQESGVDMRPKADKPTVLRDRGRELEDKNSRPGGWRGLLGRRK